MKAFCILFISLVSILPLDAKDEVPELNILIEEKYYVSENLGVTIASLPKNTIKIPDVCLQVLVDRENVRPDPGLQLIRTTMDHFSHLDEVPITFDSSEADLFDIPLNVTVSIFLPDETGCKTDQDLLLANKTALLYDNRVSIEWKHDQVDCVVNDSCSFSAKIGRTGHSREGPLNLTANVTGPVQDSITERTIISPITPKSDDVYFDYMFHQIGTYTALLSVPYSLRKSVYWKQQSLFANVKTNMILKLQGEVDILKSQVIDLESVVGNLARTIEDMSCRLLDCGNHSTCKNGICQCILPSVYNGSKCKDFVGCENSPGACGSGLNGECKEPENPSTDNLYSCRCFDGLSGQDCNNCSDSFCNNHGLCIVKNGRPACQCANGFNGSTCERQRCTEDCGDHGHCVIGENGEPQCECDTNFKGPGCAICIDGWGGKNCDQPHCNASFKDVVCNGGVCNANGTGCDCKNTNRTGTFCQYKKCNESDASGFCKDSNSVCVYNSTDHKKMCICDGVHGFVVASNETCAGIHVHTEHTVHTVELPSPTEHTVEPPSPTSPLDHCDSSPCQNDGTCTPSDDGYRCVCQPDFTGENCEVKTNPATSGVQSDSNSQLLYGGLAVFIAILVVCVATYLAYHNRDKIFELFGVKKETVVEMAMRSRTRSKGYKKLPTSIHDTLTHED